MLEAIFLFVEVQIDLLIDEYPLALSSLGHPSDTANPDETGWMLQSS
jgi:hypothetical protein